MERMPHTGKMTTLPIIAIVIFVVAAAAWWIVLFGRPNPPLPQATMAIEPLTVDGATFTVELATTTIAQARGLSYRTSLGANDGMLFVFPSGGIQTFWMKDMNFPLDIIWISGTTVAGFVQDAPAMPGVAFPTSTYSSPPGVSTDKVLEVNAGTVEKYHIRAGDTVVIGPIQ